MNEMTKTKSEDRQAKVAHGLGAAVGAFVVGTIGLSVAIYVTGGQTAAANGFSGDEMGMFDVTTIAAVGMATAVIQLVMALIGMVTAMGTAIFGLAVGAIGIAGAVIVGAGIISGPILLLAGLVILIKRHFYPDVI